MKNLSRKLIRRICVNSSKDDKNVVFICNSVVQSAFPDIHWHHEIKLTRTQISDTTGFLFDQDQLLYCIGTFTEEKFDFKHVSYDIDLAVYNRPPVVSPEGRVYFVEHHTGNTIDAPHAKALLKLWITIEDAQKMFDIDIQLEDLDRARVFHAMRGKGHNIIINGISNKMIRRIP